MTRKGQLTVIGTQQDDSGENQTTQTAAAEYYTGNGSLYILYEESAGEGEGITKNMIKLKDRTMELTKKGAVNTHMVFEPGQEHTTLYSTPFGSLPLGIRTETVESVLSEKELRIRAVYSLTCQDQTVPGLTRQAPVSQSSIIARCEILIKMLLQG